MTPKEKAKELVDKFYQTTPNEAWINKPVGLSEEYKAWKQAKECALIAVDEIIKESSIGLLLIDWWKEVKKEINKLQNK